MGLWHKYPSVAYLAVFLGVTGHASSEFVSVLSGVAGPELSVWRFLIGGAAFSLSGSIGEMICRFIAGHTKLRTPSRIDMSSSSSKNCMPSTLEKNARVFSISLTI